jgi:hypothetical protein
MVKPVRSHIAFSARLLAGAGLGIVLSLPVPAWAGDPQAPDPIAEEIRKSLAQDGAPSEPIDWDALNWDPWSLTTPAKPSSLSGGSNPVDTPLSWNHKVNSDGSASYVAKKQLPAAFDTNVGVDVNAASDQNDLPLDRLMASPAPANSGAAWANVNMSGASIDARVDPRQDQARLGTTLKKSVPMNDSLSVSLENGYSVTDTYTTGTAGMWGAPSTAAPRVYAADGTARLTYEPTGTTFSTGTRLSSADEKWRHSVGAEQKLFGGLNVSGSVSETDTGAFDRTLSAGYKTTW